MVGRRELKRGKDYLIEIDHELETIFIIGGSLSNELFMDIIKDNSDYKIGTKKYVPHIIEPITTDEKTFSDFKSDDVFEKHYKWITTKTF